MLQENTTFEKHYRIGDLARTWGLGRETVRKLVKDDLSRFSGRGTGGTLPRPSHDCAVSHWEVTALASCQSGLPVNLRLNWPASVPEAKMKQAQRFQPSLRSSNSPDRDSSG
jgi:hypothetical protein